MRFAPFAAAVGLLLSGTIAVAQSVNYDFDRSANFSAFKTYAWARGAELTDDLNHARVVRAMARASSSSVRKATRCRRAS